MNIDELRTTFGSLALEKTFWGVQNVLPALKTGGGRQKDPPRSLKAWSTPQNMASLGLGLRLQCDPT